MRQSDRMWKVDKFQSEVVKGPHVGYNIDHIQADGIEIAAVE